MADTVCRSFASQVGYHLNSGFAMSEDLPVGRTGNRAMLAPLRFACAALEPSMKEKAISPARIAWIPRERSNVNQLYVEAVFLKPLLQPQTCRFERR